MNAVSDEEILSFLVYGRLAELENMYQIAINGADEERAAAASILCGASLARSWNVQVRLYLQFLI
jgi:hypothetical protein